MGQHEPVKWLSSVLLLPTLLNGCATVGTAPVAAPAITTSLRAAAAERIDRFIASEMQKRHIAGLSAAVVSGGQVRYAKGYGLADIERQVPVLADTPFLIASVTKMFTAVATMLLVEDGKVQLDTPVGTYVDRLPAHWRAATVRQLLGHTSGINSFTSHDTPPCGRTADEQDYDQQSVIAEVSCLPLDFEPGTSWSYSDTGYFVLGLLIERVSGPVLRTMWKPLGIGTALYGLGFAVRPIKGRRQVGHTGGGPGAATSFARLVDDDLTVVVLTNTAQPPQSIQEIVGGIADCVLQPVAEP